MLLGKISLCGSEGSKVESFSSNDQKVKEFFNKPVRNIFVMIKENGNYYHGNTPIYKIYT